ncbi:BRISC and BRCA1-A complex member 2-like isoform X2 [Oratosquilla oratoria]|uniref:BRISC and BRCA1-A complex member 2-like isoform X2 n=1 Tax=Oratosquilla oratoria TaxID=337810 RepID=UPI003F7706D8
MHGKNRMGSTQVEGPIAFARQLDYIKGNGIPGLCGDLVEIVGRGDDLASWESKEDCLTLNIPYAGGSFSVHLLLQAEEPWIPPDVSFEDQEFMSSITVKDLEDQVPALNNWDYHKDDIVAQLVFQILQLYKKHQLEKLEEDSRLQFEYQSVLGTLDLGESDIEVCTNGVGYQAPSFLIRLPLSLQDVPPILVDANPGPAIALLQVAFHGNEGKFTPKLHLSPRVEAVIGGSGSFSLPYVAPGLCLIDYLPQLIQMLEQKVKTVVLGFEMRKQFIAQVLCQFGCAILEYDAEKFSKMCLLFEWKEFHFLLLITLPVHFPQEPPCLSLRSVYHSTFGLPISKELQDMPYSPRWSPEEMVTRLRQAMLQYLPTFQQDCVSSAAKEHSK